MFRKIILLNIIQQYGVKNKGWFSKVYIEIKKKSSSKLKSVFRVKINDPIYVEE